MTQAMALPTADEVFRDVSASSWLKSALQSALERDPVDALNDALALAEVLEDRLRTALDIDGGS
jgi:hypothetical protein